MMSAGFFPPEDIVYSSAAAAEGATKTIASGEKHFLETHCTVLVTKSIISIILEPKKIFCLVSVFIVLCVASSYFTNDTA